MTEKTIERVLHNQNRICTFVENLDDFRNLEKYENMKKFVFLGIAVLFMDNSLRVL
jgi:hypothetical protein